MALSTCPTSTQLTRLGRHPLTSLELEEIASHIGQCEACRNFLEKLPADDSSRSHSDTKKASANGESAEEHQWPRTVGPFHILTRLGGGGMGDAYFAWQPLMRRFCVVKMIRADRVLNPEIQERFLLEIRAQAALSEKTEHIMPVLSADTDPDTNILYMAMPFFPGQTLEQRLCGGLPMPIQEVLHTAQEFLQGIAVAHRAGMLHRDIKPSNIYLEDRDSAPGRPRVRIIDFGLTKPLEGAPGVTQAGVAIGTPGYMSPEQLRGDEVDARTDLFAFGCTLYRMLTGRLPFPGLDPKSMKPSWSEYRRQVIDPTFAPKAIVAENSQASRALNDLVLILLAKAPENRPASAQAVADALQQIQADPQADVTKTLMPLQLPDEKHVETTPPGMSPKKERSVGCTITITFAACVLFAAVSVGAYAVHNGNQERYATALAEIESAQKELEEMKRSIQQNEALMAQKRQLELEHNRKWDDFMEKHKAKQRELDAERDRELQKLAAAKDQDAISRLEKKRRQEQDDLDRLEKDRLAANAKAQADVKAEIAKLQAQVEAANQRAQQATMVVSQPPPVYYPPYHYRYWGW